MSRTRPALHCAGAASLVLAALNAAAAAWAASSGADASALKLPLLAGFGFCFVIALVVASQFTQLARRLNPGEPTGGDLDGLQFRELRRLLRWSPWPHKAVGALGLVAFPVTLVAVGGVTWHTGEPFEPRHAYGIALYVFAFYAIAAPVLAALARLPLALDEQVRAFKTDDA